jgi:peptidoglycan/xylan/chitin deacetylase (PgdA/CDA1 family)
MTIPREGMDHALYGFSAMPDRAPLRWPDDHALAGTVFLYLEHWELLPQDGTLRDPRFRDPFGDFKPDYRTYTWREYGNRVGVFRLLDVLDRSGLKVTVAANASACDRCPYLIEELLRRDYELAAHGSHATRLLTSRMSEAEEREFIASSIARVSRASGKACAGWIGQDYAESTRTPFLLAEAGLTYLSDWPNDDLPYLMAGGRIVSLPNQSEWDDVQLMWHRRVLAPRFAAIVTEAATGLAAEAVQTKSGRFMGLHLHPWLSGMPHRFPHVARAIEAFAATPGLWPATAAEVAQAAAMQLRPKSK